jgi:anti-sigma B factor antagonist
MVSVPSLAARAQPCFELSVVVVDPLRSSFCASGELDLSARDLFAEGLQQQQDAGRRFVNLDLSRVTFIDNSCLHVIEAFHESFLKLPGLMILTGINPRVARMLKLTDLRRRLFIAADNEDPFGEAEIVPAGTRR